MPPPDFPDIAPLLDAALREDIGTGDLTSLAVVPAGIRARGRFVAREDGILAAGPILEPLFQKLDPDVQIDLLKADGQQLAEGDELATIEGLAAPILTGERTALNFLQRLSGIASLTRRYVDRAKPHGAEILDTRKTTPGWRRLEKYAVAAGGGRNHRMGLYDQVLIKDNHLLLAGQRWPQRTIAAAVDAARTQCPEGTRIEVEADTLDQALEAMEAGAEIVMLDNMTDEQMREVVEMAEGCTPRPILEASGGVTLDRIEAIARTGVDWISVGALTHSAPALDIALDLEPPG